MDDDQATRLEEKLSVLARNFGEHAEMELHQTAQLRAAVETLSVQVRAIYEVMGNLAGTPSNFMLLAEEIKGARGLSKRMWKIAAWLMAASATIIGLLKCTPKGGD